MGRRDKVEQLVDRYARWLPGEADPEDLGNLDLLLLVRRDYLDANAITWRKGDITELLLGVLPRKVQSDPTLLTDGPRVLGEFLQFLDQNGELRGSGIYALQIELAEVAPRFAPAMQDSSRLGMAKSLFGAMSADGVAVDDPRAMQEWIEQFNARPYDERVALTDPAMGVMQDDEIVLPPVSLASEEELRRAAAAAPLVVRVGALLSHVGPQGRPTTQTGALRLVDAKALAPTCGDEERLERPKRWEGQVRRMADLPGVEEAYELAVHVGLLEQTASRVRRNPAHPGATDELARVAVLADAALELGIYVGDAPYYRDDLAEEIGEQLPGILSVLYQAGEPLGVDELTERLAEVLGLSDEGPGSLASSARHMLERSFARFDRLGLLARLGLHVPPAYAELGLDTERATSVTLTPLGTWWLQRTLTRFGLRAPLVGELASVSAAELSDGLDGYSVEAAQAELAGWAAVRGPEEAARQMAALLGDADVSRRQLALRALDDMAEAEYAVRALLDDPAARAYARFWLESHGHEVAGPIDVADELLIFVDIAAMMIDLGALDDLLEKLSGFGEVDRQVELVRQLWRVESPFTEPVLQALARSAPQVVSKAARKALFSLRSARH